jgi:hypothetical protein
MNAPPHHARSHRLQDVFENPPVQVGLLTAVALLVEILLMKYVLDANPSLLVLLGPLWVFSVYKVSGRRDRISNIVTSIAVVVATGVVLLAYAL